MPGIKVAKPQAERIKECIVILRKLITELEIPAENPSIKLLTKRMSDYWREGKYAEDRIPLVNSDRYILYRFPKWSYEIVEVTLRKGHILHTAPSDAMLDEIEAGQKEVRSVEMDSLLNAATAPATAPA
jgi:hypothetical protein